MTCKHPSSVGWGPEAWAPSGTPGPGVGDDNARWLCLQHVSSSLPRPGTAPASLALQGLSGFCAPLACGARNLDEPGRGPLRFCHWPSTVFAEMWHLLVFVVLFVSFFFFFFLNRNFVFKENKCCGKDGWWLPKRSHSARSAPCRCPMSCLGLSLFPDGDVLQPPNCHDCTYNLAGMTVVTTSCFISRCPR